MPSSEGSSAGAVAEKFATGPDGEAVLCQVCKTGKLGSAEVKTALWHGASLVVVEDVPALVCEQCGEQYYQDEVAMVLDLMRGDGFDAEGADRTISVPVFGFRALGSALRSQQEQRPSVAGKSRADVTDSV
jgi:YgiT-type zinc finger domain-containing protein